MEKRGVIDEETPPEQGTKAATAGQTPEEIAESRRAHPTTRMADAAEKAATESRQSR